VIVYPEAHNPQAIQAPDGTYIIYDSYGGCTATTSNCVSETPCPCTKAGPGNFTLHYSSSPKGPWTKYVAAITYPCYSCNLTPSPLFHPNGTLYIIFHCDADNSHQQCDLTAVSAKTWKGPYDVVKSGQSIWGFNQSDNHPEDPFVWLDVRGDWHILMHNGPHGLHIFSTDGLNYTTANNNQGPYPYTTNITTTNGIDAVNRRERPWFLINEEKNVPTLLVTSVEPKSGNAYTHTQQINVG